MDCSKCNGYATMLLNMVQGSDPVNLLELHGFLEHFRILCFIWQI